MTLKRATSRAGINIALVKYWGKHDEVENLPAVGSISLTLADLGTVTSVSFETELRSDIFVLNGEEMEDPRVFRSLEGVRRVAEITSFARVESENSAPTASGLASSASGSAALVHAAWCAAGMSTENLSDNNDFLGLVRRGSGSAPRSVLGGLVELERETGRVIQLLSEDAWDIAMVVVRLTNAKKSVSSRKGMRSSRETSPYYPAWVASHPEDLKTARNAINARDLEALGEVMERSTLKMHACMMANQPPLRYWRKDTLAVMDAVEELRRNGTPCWYTMDAGPHVKILCERKDARLLCHELSAIVPSEAISISLPGPGVTAERP